MKPIAILTVLFSCVSISTKAQNAVEIIQQTISKIKNCKTISYYSKQKWGNPGDTTDFSPLEGPCTFKLIQLDTVIKAHYRLESDGITDFYSGDKLTRVNQTDGSLTVYDLKKYPKEKNSITSKMLYTGSVMDIYNFFLNAKKGSCKIQKLKDTIFLGKPVSRIVLVYTDTIINTQKTFFQKVVFIDKKTFLPLHYSSLLISAYGTQIIENALSDYRINFPLSQTYFYADNTPSSYKTIEFIPIQQSSNVFELGVNQPAPAFNLPAIQGGEIGLSSLKGKTILLEFSGLHCGFCLVAVKDLKKINSSYDSTKFRLLSVYSDAEKNQLEKYIERYQIPYPILFNGKTQKDNQLLLNKYGVSGIPHFIIIDKDGIVKWNSVGFREGLYTTLTEEINKLLN